ncbi:MAG: transketolase [Candidatus Promineifilaceae bacterium]
MQLELMKKSADTIRVLAMDAVQAANSGHPGTPMGLADLAVVLWSEVMDYDPQRPDWVNRDRFVLSAGHASMLQYAALHLTGYDVSLDDLEQFRQWGSATPGHPEFGHTAGIETTTGPLGQGLANAVGMAIAEQHLGMIYNRPNFNLIDHHTYVIAGDGDMMEGVCHEACALAGHLGLGKLLVFYDDNKITIDGATELAHSEDAGARFAAYGWHVLHVDDGHDMAALLAATQTAKAEAERPSLIICRTHIGFGSPNKQDTAAAHGSPLGADEVMLTKLEMGWTYDPFDVPDEVAEFMLGVGQKSAEAYQSWEKRFQSYIQLYPQMGALFARGFKGVLPDGWQSALPAFGTIETMATRAASGKVLEELVPYVPVLVGGSADLTGSNKTLATNMPIFQRNARDGRYIHYGVREHAMGSIMNGMALYGGLRPYGGTFLIFSDYMRPAMRLAALMKLPVTYVLTHDSIGLGEDGPTHQPIEQLSSLRAIPNLWVFRPADANETALGWLVALERDDGPTALILTRQSVPTLPEDVRGALHGGYVLSDRNNAQVILIATGSEVQIAIEAQEQLDEIGIRSRVVSLPCWELFERQSADYRASVLPHHITARVSIEAAATFGWARYLGTFGKAIGIDQFGASAPADVLYEQFGISAENVVATVHAMFA